MISPGMHTRGRLSQRCTPVPLWEWTVPRDEVGASCGVSMTREGAAQALATALVQGGRARSGEVVSVLLTDPADRDPYSIRGQVERAANFDYKGITWT